MMKIAEGKQSITLKKGEPRMTIPALTTERLLLQPLVAEDAVQIQKLYPRWEIVRYMVSSVGPTRKMAQRITLTMLHCRIWQKVLLVLEHPAA
jgi:hypothetical protein